MLRSGRRRSEGGGGVVVSESANESLPQVAGVAAMIFNFTRESHALILLLPFAYSLSFATFPPAKLPPTLLPFPLPIHLTPWSQLTLMTRQFSLIEMVRNPTRRWPC